MVRLVFLFLSLSLLFGCSKDSDNMVVGSSKLEINLSTVSSGNNQKSSNLKSAIIREPLDKNIKYRVVVFNATNQYIQHSDFMTGQPAFIEVPNTILTIVIYSINTQTLPEHNTNLSLNGEQQFLYFKKQVDLSNGIPQTLDAVLKNVFSQISINLTSEIGTVQKVRTKVSNYFVNPKITILDTAVVFGSASEFVTDKTNFYIATSNNVINTFNMDITINGVTKTKTFNRNVKKGEWFELNSKITEGFIVGDYEWAKGNLKYENGKYFFATRQSDEGEYWLWNLATPRSLLTLLDWQLVNLMAEYKYENDPCSKVSGGWRTPSQAELETLYATGNYRIKIENGVRGLSFTDNDVFLPIYEKRTGIFLGDLNQGSYWTRDNLTSQNAKRFHFGQWSETQHWRQFNSDYKATRMNIRCVRNN